MCYPLQPLELRSQLKLGVQFHTTSRSCLQFWPSTFHRVCVCVCEFISASDGARCARQPGSSGATLCGQGTVCPLSCCFEFTTNLTAASSLIHCSRWWRALLFACARVCPILLERQLWGGNALPAAVSSFMRRQQRWGNWNWTEIKLWNMKELERACVQSRLPYRSLSSREAVSSESNPWDYIPAWWTMSILFWSCCCNPAQHPMQ